MNAHPTCDAPAPGASPFDDEPRCGAPATHYCEGAIRGVGGKPLRYHYCSAHLDATVFECQPLEPAGVGGVS